MRDALERILRGRTGALVVLGFDRAVEQLCTGRVRARRAVLGDRAARAGQDGRRGDPRPRGDPDPARPTCTWSPTPSIPTEESGTRHRTAERVAKQTGYPVISVSQSMRIIALYVGRPAVRARGLRDDPVQGQPGAGHPRAVQAAPRRGVRARCRRWRSRTWSPSATWPRSPSGWRWSAGSPSEIEGYVVELGTDGRLLSLQLDELIAGVETDRELIARDYLPAQHGRRHRTVAEVLADLDALSRHRPARPRRRRPRPRALRRRRAARHPVTPARLPAAGPGAAAARARWSTGSSSTSAPCRSCSPRASTTCRRSRASARAGPARSARACPGWPSPRSSSGTSESADPRSLRRAAGEGGVAAPASDPQVHQQHRTSLVVRCCAAPPGRRPAGPPGAAPCRSRTASCSTTATHPVDGHARPDPPRPAT